MPRLPIAPRRPAGAAVALAALLALPWPFAARLDSLLDRLLATWHEVVAEGDEEPPPDETTASRPAPTDPPRHGPSTDPDGNDLGDGPDASSTSSP